ncbi:MAG: hypothetical protein R3Y06_09500 [Faecalibacterium sp.]
MNIGLLSIDGHIPLSLKDDLFHSATEFFLIENHALETTVLSYAFQQKIPVTILPFVSAFTEQSFYIAQIDALAKRCDTFVCFAHKDCAQLQWCLDYAKKINLEITVHEP